MTNFALNGSRALLTCVAIAVVAGPTFASHHTSGKVAGRQAHSKGMAVAYPWVFQNGHSTSKKTVFSTAEEIARKADYASIPHDVAKSAWASHRLSKPSFGHLPTAASLKAFGKAVHATTVLYGSVSWHTRSIWVNLGPKTISTATVSVYVFDVAAGKVVFKKTGVEGRSDEKSNGYKLAADVLISPLVTAVSGGPATPQEQRAVQIALGVAYHNWVKPGS